jgi:hypothetical protein
MTIKSSKYFFNRCNITHKNEMSSISSINKIDRPSNECGDVLLRPVATHPLEIATPRNPVVFSPASVAKHDKNIKEKLGSHTSTFNTERGATCINGVDDPVPPITNVVERCDTKGSTVVSDAQHRHSSPQDHIPLKKRRIRRSGRYFPSRSSCSNDCKHPTHRAFVSITGFHVHDRSASSIRVDETSLRRLVASCWKYYPHSTALLPEDYYREHDHLQNDETSAENLCGAEVQIDMNPIKSSYSPNWLKITKLPPTSGSYHYYDDIVNDQDLQTKRALKLILAPDEFDIGDLGLGKSVRYIENTKSILVDIGSPILKSEDEELRDRSTSNLRRNDGRSEKEKDLEKLIITTSALDDENKSTDESSHDEDGHCHDIEIAMIAKSVANVAHFQLNDIVNHASPVTPSPLPFYILENIEENTKSASVSV